MELNLTAGKIKDAMSSVGAKSSDLYHPPVDQINIFPDFNVREENEEYLEHVATIKALIKANGFRKDKPLSGYVNLEGGKNVIYITDGHTRLRAVRELIAEGVEILTLPVVMAPKGTNIEDLTLGLATSNNGKPLQPYELAKVCKRLLGFNWDEATIAGKLGMTTQRVNELLGLIGADPEIRGMVAAGEVSASQAIKTMKAEGDGAKTALKEGVAKAKAAGKKRATAKHIATSRPNYKAVAEALLAWSKATAYEVPEDLKPVLKLARDATK